MIVRDRSASLNGIDENLECPNGIVILSSEGQDMLSIQEKSPGVFTISTVCSFKHQGIIFDTDIVIKPVASNTVRVIFPEYNPKKMR